ncbi:MAG: glutamate mutase L, partial [Candidatus Marinimicrobia bacterium]|nr:glutamate mutase L [Candidatus Neomarinimicrobiota bacterium]
MSKINIDNIKVILATDCGSTTTKAILIQKTDGQFRQSHRGEAPSTVEEPFADVTVGVVNSVTEIAELAGRRLINDDGKIITPAKGDEGCDIYISTSSAGGGLQMMVAGVIREMTAASAKRAALGAGAIVMDVIASNDKRQPHEQIQRIRELRPDMILLSGGTDGGTKTHVVKIAELIAPAKPQPRFGAQYQLPLIYAGNKEASGNMDELFKEDFELSVVENLRPTLEQENLSPARDAIHDLFLEHVMAHAPGYNRLIQWADAPIMPTPGAVGNILQTIAEQYRINVVGVDIGGATTDVFSVFDGIFNRTVSANLGMSYSISNVCAEATMPSIMRWMHLDMNERELRNRVKNKMIRPTTIPQSIDALIFEQAVAREALRLAYVQHKEFATTLKGIQQQRTVGDTFSQEVGGQTIVDNMKLNLLVASGGVLSHAPHMQQTAMMLIDAFQPEGVTTLAKDSIFMMPHLGVLAQVHPQATMDVFEKDCLIYLGSVVAPKGNGTKGNTCFRYEIIGKILNQSGDMAFGEMELHPLGIGEE